MYKPFQESDVYFIPIAYGSPNGADPVIPFTCVHLSMTTHLPCGRCLRCKERLQ